MFLPGDKIKDPRQYEADHGKLEKRFDTVKYSFPRRAIGKYRECNRDEKSESYQINKVDHFFLPSEISTESTVAR